MTLEFGINWQIRPIIGIAGFFVLETETHILRCGSFTAMPGRTWASCQVPHD
jgi:hypothetical protein